MANSLSPANSITVIRGTSRTIEVTFQNQETGEAVDLTGSRILFTVKSDIRDTLPTIQKDSSVGITQVEITNALAGTARVYINYMDTHDLDLGDYVYDLWIVLSSGKRYTAVAPSVFSVEAGVTIIP